MLNGGRTTRSSCRYFAACGPTVPLSRRAGSLGQLLALSVLAGCAAERPPIPPGLSNNTPTASADSDAVAVVTIRVDSLSGDAVWSQPVDVRLLADGRVAALCCDNRLVVFGAGGQQESMFGRRGSGPGEFAVPHMTILPGDTILIYDRTLRRATWIHPRSGVIREHRFLQATSDYFVPLGAIDDTTLILADLNQYSDHKYRAARDSLRTTAEAASVTSNTPPLQLFRLPDVLITWRESSDGSSARSIDEVRFGGRARIRMRGPLAYVLPGGAARIDIHDTRSGAVVRTIPLPPTRKVVDRADRELMLATEIQALSSMYPGGVPPRRLAWNRSAVFADSFPPADELLLDMSGQELVIVEGKSMAAPGWRAIRVGSDGQVVGVIHSARARSYPVDFRHNSLLIANWDEDGASTLEIRKFAP